MPDEKAPGSSVPADPAVGRTPEQEASVAGANQAHYQGIIDGIDQEYRNEVEAAGDSVKSAREAAEKAVEKAERDHEDAVNAAKAKRSNALIDAGVMTDKGKAVYPDTTIPSDKIDS